jgi:hypothetical protein
MCNRQRILFNFSMSKLQDIGYEQPSWFSRTLRTREGHEIKCEPKAKIVVGTSTMSGIEINFFNQKQNIACSFKSYKQNSVLFNI